MSTIDGGGSGSWVVGVGEGEGAEEKRHAKHGGGMVLDGGGTDLAGKKKKRRQQRRRHILMVEAKMDAAAEGYARVKQATTCPRPFFDGCNFKGVEQDGSASASTYCDCCTLCGFHGLSRFEQIAALARVDETSRIESRRCCRLLRTFNLDSSTDMPASLVLQSLSSATTRVSRRPTSTLTSGPSTRSPSFLASVSATRCAHIGKEHASSSLSERTI